MSIGKAVEEGAQAAGRGALEGGFAKLITAITQKGAEHISREIDKFADDLLSTKGPLDDAAGSIILQRFKDYNKTSHKRLLRLLDVLPKTERDEFIVICIGHIFLTSQKNPEKATTEKTDLGKEDLLLGINFNDTQTYDSLFKTLKSMLKDFAKLNLPNDLTPQLKAEFHPKVKKLIQDYNLYGDNTMAKKLAGLFIIFHDHEKFKQKLIQGLSKILKPAKKLWEKIGDSESKAEAFNKSGDDFLAKQLERREGRKVKNEQAS